MNVLYNNIKDKLNIKEMEKEKWFIQIMINIKENG